MAERYLERNDLINGRFARAVAVLDGRRETLFYLKNLKAESKTKREAIPRLGTPVDLSVGGSVTNTFTATLYKTTNFFRDIQKKYINENIDLSFELIVTQNDPNYSGGEFTQILKDCYLSGAVIAQMDIEKSQLDEEVEGTFGKVVDV